MILRTRLGLGLRRGPAPAIRAAGSMIQRGRPELCLPRNLSGGWRAHGARRPGIVPASGLARSIGRHAQAILDAPCAPPLEPLPRQPSWLGSALLDAPAPHSALTFLNRVGWPLG